MKKWSFVLIISFLLHGFAQGQIIGLLNVSASCFNCIVSIPLFLCASYATTICLCDAYKIGKKWRQEQSFDISQHFWEIKPIDPSKSSNINYVVRHNNRNNNATTVFAINAVRCLVRSNSRKKKYKIELKNALINAGKIGAMALLMGFFSVVSTKEVFTIIKSKWWR